MKYTGELELDLDNGKIKFHSFDNTTHIFILGLETRTGLRLPDSKEPPVKLIKVTPKTYIGVTQNE